MEINGLLPQGFEKHFKIDNAEERFEEAEKVGKRLLGGGIALKNNADHYAIFTDPPRLLADPLRRIGYIVGADNRCYPSPVDDYDYINVAASLPELSLAKEKGWPDHVAIVHPLDESGHRHMMDQGYGNPFIHHITWGIKLPEADFSEEMDLAGALVSRMIQTRDRIAGLLKEELGTLIMAMPRTVLRDQCFTERFAGWIGSTPTEQYQLEEMEGGGYLLQFFLLKGGRIEVALRFNTVQTFNPKSVHKISKDELSVDQRY